MTAPATRARIAPRWHRPEPPDGQLVAALADALKLPPMVCELLVARGHADAEEAKRFLRPRLEQLHPPGAMLGMDAAVDRLARAITGGETILVHGDYDVDGICSTTIMVRVIRHLGGTAIPFLPHRLHDGYDLGDAGVKAARDAGARVVLTCDCGTSAHDAIDALTASGIDVIVSDHHLPSRPVPTCLAVLNPQQPGCAYPDKGLCAAGVAYKLAVALLAALGGHEHVALHLLDLVALATIADVAPLRGENRILVRFGLKLMAETRHAGLRALMEASGLEGKALTAGRVGFILAPRLNAAGRVGHAMRGVELLLATDQGEANRIARELEEMNRARQELDRATLDAARAMADRLDLDETWGVVLGADGWHPGVIGIVASRLVEELARPVFMVALDRGVGKGSGRSISAFDLHGALTACRDLLVRYGGHRAAAGITIDAERMPAFAERFNAVARERLTLDDLVPRVRVDLELPLESITGDLETLLKHFEPFGVGNPAPVLSSRGVRLATTPRVVGQGGLKLQLARSGGTLEAIGWGMGELARELSPASPVDVAYRLERDTYGGTSRLVARLADVRA
ncbi:MAG TPA: single-stranded-DNA-specific exonuclease RecJ [Gemmatimonadaceae bacterium]|nr:single-stranded-DNA-specific exonuclease RecJ [Gemmatimonadaceae bacterium]